MESPTFATLIANVVKLKAEHAAICKQQERLLEKLNMLIQLGFPTFESEDSGDALPSYRRKKGELTPKACKGAPSTEDSPIKV